MRVLGVALLLAIAVPSSARGDFEWALEQEFEFLEFHDPGYLMLKDATGKESELIFGYEGLTYEVVSTWPQGKKIRLVYTPEKGTELVDLEDGARYPIQAAMPPIDELAEHCVERNGTTAGMVVCFRGEAKAWDSEMNRVYRSLMESDFSDETKLAVRTAQREWIKFRDASMAAIRAVRDESSGTIRAIEAGSAAVALTRGQALMLRGYLVH
jgi:uncharacterized protein YecT (DUF1311 family)